jgi:cytochrome P450
MINSLKTALGLASSAFLTRSLALMGDPFGQLETTSDLVAFSDRLRTNRVVRSRIGVLLSADVLKSPNWKTKAEPRNFLEELFLGSTAQSDRIDPFYDSLVLKDGKEHTRIRKLVQPAFTHSVMQAWYEAADKIAAKLVNEMSPSGDVELVSAWANQLPLAMICEILGVPFADQKSFTSWGNTLATLGLDGPRSMKQARDYTLASDQLIAYMSNLLKERKRNPQEDLLSTLAQAELDGDTLSDREIVATAAFLLIAGFETTVNLLSVGTLTLIQNKEQLLSVSNNHDLIPQLVEETLRYVSPVQYTLRTASSATQLIDGTFVSSGETILLMLVGANRDPNIFASPHEFFVSRENARRNLAFGYGAHQCLGASLARMEAEVAWRHLFLRFPDVEAWRLNNQPTIRPGRVIRGLQSLPVQLGRAR